MRTPRLLAAAAAAVLATAGCTDRSATLSAPEGPRNTYLTSLHVYCTSTIAVGTASACTAYGMDSNGNYNNYTYSASWGSTNYGVLSVNAVGGIYGISPGYAGIYAMVGGVTGYSTSIQVYQPAPPPTATSITITPSSGTIATGQSALLSATVKDQNGNTMSGQTVTWSSSNTSIAAVSSTGYLTAGSATGSVTITATSGSASGTATFNVVTGFNVSISGESVVKPNVSCSWFGEVSGGVGPYTYAWSAQNASGSSVYEPSSWTGQSSASSFTIHLTVTDSRGVAIGASKQVSTSTTLGSHWVCIQ